CRHLTRSAWDAEDLAQEAMARAFVTLGQMGSAPPNLRAWLFRVASNLWFDQLRRRHREEPLGEHDKTTPARDPRVSREVAGTLLGQLSPQERAAVVLKHAFDRSLEEIAGALSTTTGAVKAALHRGRGKLVQPATNDTPAPAPGVLDAFCAEFNAADLDRLTSLLLDTAAVEVVGATTQYGPEAARRASRGVGIRSLVRARRRRSGARDHTRRAGGRSRSAPSELLLQPRLHCGGLRRARPALAFQRLPLVELGLPWRSSGYRWSCC